MYENKLRELINILQDVGEELDFLDAKRELVLKENGDKAEFVKDIEAMANNFAPSFLIIRLTDGSFQPVGKLSRHYDQNTINQILADKIDPPIAVDYQELLLDGNEFGLIIINGDNPPYIVARDIAPNRTDRKKSRVAKGTVFVRHGNGTRGISRSELDHLISINQPKLKISFERDSSVRNDYKTKISLLCYLSNDGPVTGQDLSVRMYFHGCELHHCPDWVHGHDSDHFGNPNDKTSLTYSTPSIHVRETSEPLRFTLKLLRRKWKAIHVVLKGTNFDESGCVIALSDITKKPKWMSVNLPVEYKIET